MLAFTSPDTVSTVSTMTVRTIVIVQTPQRRGGRVDRLLRTVVTERHPLPDSRAPAVS
ncbi:hypothetical protein GCM10023203_44800 [Actinomycetospora straminea]|uniref:Uncharacterized protein n=1 Tax=Actinomycetospora straminea TaxID=663607 RepID=A0ABP9EU62_9PSEU